MLKDFVLTKLFLFFVFKTLNQKIEKMKNRILMATVFNALFAFSTMTVAAQNATPQQSNPVAPKQAHPRRQQVNARLKNQNERIDKKVDEGKMSKAEGNKLKKNDHEIRQEERDMAKQNGGHITKQEQKTLNQQENRNSRKIKKH